ncbi:D-alanine--D-alanine ligase [Halobacteriovorax sp. JY17]|uniref:D-alanine--D-alanine ligase n=1 Tax=Halobacteriovorax sp. JY17 TaxID=2014617 RepID=UPI000C558FFC|nr:D-alanine--D-alanine ligase [Halobacteriovorax sp. JY17]PIK15820.1 MAG: D-alanine--D-alanine ligase A [Halobacteriovorax sp. JY17]
MKNILLLCGGGGSEHDVSLRSADYIYNELLSLNLYKVFKVEIKHNGDRIDQNGELCELRKAGELHFPNSKTTENLDFAIPCIHGPPGENGIIQSIFELMGLPYLGCRPEPSQTCFNKVTTKLWLDTLDIPNTPYVYLSDDSEKSLTKARDFFQTHKDVYIKAASQGSSVGCYHVASREEVDNMIRKAFTFSDYVLIEKTIKARELEVSVYEFNGEIRVSLPGEIICPDGFYDFDQKYSNESKTKTDIEAKNLSSEVINSIQGYALEAFKGLKLRHLSRVDFFFTDTGEVYLNEINTFPGMTPISMFPKMMENHGTKFSQFLKNIIEESI